MTEHAKEYQKRYMRNATRLVVNLYPTDGDIRKFLEAKNAEGIPTASLIKALLRKEMAK